MTINSGFVKGRGHETRYIQRPSRTWKSPNSGQSVKYEPALGRFYSVTRGSACLLPTTMLTGLFSQGLDLVKRLLIDRRYFAALAFLVLVGDAVLTQLIIRFIPCTSEPRTIYVHRS